MQAYGAKQPVLVGNTLDVDTLQWVRHDASVGAGIDSFYEYLLKVRASCQSQDRHSLDWHSTIMCTPVTHVTALRR